MTRTREKETTTTTTTSGLVGKSETRARETITGGSRRPVGEKTETETIIIHGDDGDGLARR